MKQFSKQDEFTLLQTDVIEVVSNYSVSDLHAQRKQLVQQLADITAYFADQIAQVDFLLGQCDAVGIKNRLDIAPSQVVPAVAETV